MRSRLKNSFVAASLFLVVGGAALSRVVASEPVVLPDAEQFDLTAQSGDAYRIFVAAPSQPSPEAGWPVIYLSDGNSNFPLLVAAARRQSMGDQLSTVIVGIGYPADDRRTHSMRRTKDLTPAASAEF